jgi:ketosteroid isomerase-like protein
VTDDCVFDATGPAPDGMRHVGRAAIRQAWEPIFSDATSRFEPEETFAAGDRVVQLWRYLGWRTRAGRGRVPCARRQGGREALVREGLTNSGGDLMGTTDPVGAFLAGIEGAALPEDIFCEDIVLDATVPNWRFRVQGAGAVRDELGRWYADPDDSGRCDATGSTTASWWSSPQLGRSGVPHTCHQAHVVRLRDDRIASDTVFCGGRWPGPLLAQMEQAQLERNAAPGSG